MLIEEDQYIVMQTKRLPNPISNEISAVKHGNLRFITRKQFPVYIDLDLFITIILNCVMGSVDRHVGLLLLLYDWAGRPAPTSYYFFRSLILLTNPPQYL